MLCQTSIVQFVIIMYLETLNQSQHTPNYICKVFISKKMTNFIYKFEETEVLNY